jgi:ribonucleoside-diphosphate reductase alpha chain
MDVDTTGIEPALGLSTFKKLVGGGSMQFVNGTVSRALAALGYQPEQVEAIVAHVAEHGHVVGAPGLDPAHYEVFDCAMGTRAIAPMGHVRMMASVQPFLSGAISKTVNMPAEATVADVSEIYLQGWKLGLKALAIYRDNCKVGQPLTVAGSSGQAATETDAPAQADAPGHTDRPVRRRLPKIRPSRTVSFSVGGAEGYMTAGTYPDDGLGEVFIKMSKQGSTLAGVMDAFSIAISIALQYGVPLETYVSKFINMRFEPAGMTDDPDVRIAQSVMDYLFRRLALDFLPEESRAALGISTTEERTRALDAAAEAATASRPGVAGGAAGVAGGAREAGGSSGAGGTSRPGRMGAAGAAPDTGSPTPAGSLIEAIERQQGLHADAPLCFTCGVKMQPAGSCFVCTSCGSTSGCS